MRHAVASLDGSAGPDGWRALRVSWVDEGGEDRGWWREDPGWVMALVAEPAGEPPRRLA